MCKMAARARLPKIVRFPYRIQNHQVGARLQISKMQILLVDVIETACLGVFVNHAQPWLKRLLCLPRAEVPAPQRLFLAIEVETRIENFLGFTSNRIAIRVLRVS